MIMLQVMIFVFIGASSDRQCQPGTGGIATFRKRPDKRAVPHRAGARGGAMSIGTMGLLLRYPYEVRQADEYFESVQGVKITKDMLDLAKHIVEQKSEALRPFAVTGPL
jgi:hypothetical protein